MAKEVITLENGRPKRYNLQKSDILTGGDLLVNADIDAGAAIVYSKLSIANDDLTIAKTSGLQTALDAALPKAGGTMAGALTLAADPTNALHAATKQYADAISAGLDPKESVRLATTDVLDTCLAACTYTDTPSNGIFTADANGAITGLTLDGIAPADGDRILVKDEADAKQNGIYYVSQVGDGGTPWILTRATGQDGSPAAEVSSGNHSYIEKGTANQGAGFVLLGDGEVTLNTDDMDWSQFSGAGDLTEGTGIDINANVISVDMSDFDTDDLIEGANKYFSDAAAKAAAVDDTAYNEGTWNAVVDVAPSKNAVRDQIEIMLTAIGSNTSHSGGDGSDHADVASNTTHRGSDGSDHSIVGTNQTAIGTIDQGTNYTAGEAGVIGSHLDAIDTVLGTVGSGLQSLVNRSGGAISIREVVFFEEAISEVTTLTMRADSSDDLDGKYFVIHDEDDSVAVWFDVDDSGTSEPSHGQDRALEITAVVTDDSAINVAAAVHAIINADGKFTSVDNLDGTLEVTCDTGADVTDAADGDVGGAFSVNVDTQGEDAGLKKAKADAVSTAKVLGLVQAASIANDASGNIFVSPGEKITGFAGLTPGAFQYLSTATAGALQEAIPSSAGQTIYQVGKAVSDTEMIFLPELVADL